MLDETVSKVVQGAVVRKGDTGERVREVQKALGMLGKSIDGAFGDKTEKLVKAFQTSVSLGADGVVGPKTATALGIRWIAPTVNTTTLAWNSVQHPERNEWTTHLLHLVDVNLDAFNSANDANSFHPSFASLTREQKRFVWATMFVEIVRYECGFNPTSHMTESSGEESIGLLQMSVNDDRNYRLPFDYSALELRDPIKNLSVGVAVAAALVRKDGVISGGATGRWKGMARYWSTARMTTHLDEAKQKTNALKF